MQKRLFQLLKRGGATRQLEPQTVVDSHPPRILNYSAYLKTNTPKHALLSYLSQPVVDDINSGSSVRFSNDGIASSWPRVLNMLGYSVDIINWDDSSFVFNKDYDLVVSHGGINYPNLSKQLKDTTPYIYFSTGSYWKFHNEQEQKRFKAFHDRHNIKIPADRRIDHPEEEANKRADAIICLGNNDTAKTYKDFPHVYNLPIGSFTTTGHIKTAAEVEKGRKHILFIAGAGNVHKGLDLVLDALADLPDYTLHIYTFLDTEFKKVYKEQLVSPQVKIYEFEAFPCQKFLDLTKLCNVAVMPSCSEGSPGSIVESMIQGLIPVVSREAHIDVDGFGVVLENNTIKDIRASIERLAGLPERTLLSYSKQANKVGVTRHSKKHYTENLISILKKSRRY